MRKKINIKYPIERVVLSDVLPYETPLTFTNRYFYDYLIHRKKIINNSNTTKAFNAIENILFGSGKKNNPFSFKVSHKKKEFRSLSLIHPLNQLEVVNFYDKYNNLIIDACSKSQFSLRKPAVIARHIYYDDLLHNKNKDGELENSVIEQENSEYENLKSFFSYKKYSNIHRFFESYEFHRSEKKFRSLHRTDISKCFDSIYSHTISWAFYNKEIIKQNIEFSRTTFPGKFDDLMQKANANETNGILIGPEFSRIFAEIILQRIDIDVQKKIYSKYQLAHKKNYEIFRYVDDYFIFHNSDFDLDNILKTLKHCLKEYKLSINSSKSKNFEKPIITEISMAKQKISDLFINHLKFKIEDPKETDIATDTSDNSDNSDESKVYFSSNNIITRFKSIIKENDIEYKEVMNYSLAVLDNKTKKIIKNYQSYYKKGIELEENQFEKAFLEILDVSFFLYSVSPRVNSTIKICLIINKILTFVKKNKKNKYQAPFSISAEHNILKKISDEIYHILEKNKSDEDTQIESLYLLIALSNLGKEYRLSKELLYSYFNIENKNSKIRFKNDLNYFSITVLIFYIKNIKIYADLLEELKKILLKLFSSQTHEWRNETEIILLLLDVLSCPYLNSDTPEWLDSKIQNASTPKSKKKYITSKKKKKYAFKIKLLNSLGFKENCIDIIEYRKYWFTKWNNFDFGLELQAKRSKEVY
ncbi:antiviral reverse transcriptase Drt3b [Zunongwangia endophytica]|uniref:Antiviral reverse transcriptase Drt3b n=1 Tax=Zunongwangia endophytica TaxID=1808945 RepID=A0ABV8H7A1_9FLAO|nr:antiviral reverse transcriptase Drt3b [Zunongwangia endophytica]MDN3593952.1 antiviral reverse transcriptase Drt3b [Zunongwangia endophytica]